MKNKNIRKNSIEFKEYLYMSPPNSRILLTEHKKILDAFSLLAQKTRLHMENINLVNEDHVLCSSRRWLRLSERFQDMIIIVMYNDWSGFIRVHAALIKVLEYANCVVFMMNKLTWDTKRSWNIFENLDPPPKPIHSCDHKCKLVSSEIQNKKMYNVSSVNITKLYKWNQIIGPLID